MTSYGGLRSSNTQPLQCRLKRQLCNGHAALSDEIATEGVTWWHELNCLPGLMKWQISDSPNIKGNKGHGVTVLFGEALASALSPPPNAKSIPKVRRTTFCGHVARETGGLYLNAHKALRRINDHIIRASLASKTTGEAAQ